MNKSQKFTEQQQVLESIADLESRLQIKQQEISSLENEIKQLTTLNWGVQLQIDDLQHPHDELSDITQYEDIVNIKQQQIIELKSQVDQCQQELQNKQKSHQSRYIQYLNETKQITHLLKTFKDENNSTENPIAMTYQYLYQVNNISDFVQFLLKNKQCFNLLEYCCQYAKEMLLYFYFGSNFHEHFSSFSFDHKFQRSKRGCFSIGPKGQVTATWKSIQFLEDCIVSGDIDEFVASKSRMNLDQFKDSYLVAEIDSQNKIVDTFKRWIQ